MAEKNAHKLPDAKEVAKKPVGVLRGFLNFIRDYGIIGLAVGVVIGSSVNDLIKRLVADLVSPLIALFSPNGRLQHLEITLHGAVFKIGDALDAFISFLVIVLLVYLTARLILHNEDLLKKK